MAVAFKSKYTARQVEQLLDSINKLVNETDGINIKTIIQKEELPVEGEADQFYLVDGKIYYWNDEWFELTNTPAISLTIPEEDGEVEQFNFEDFIPFEDDMTYFVYNGNIVSKLKQALADSENKEKVIYPISNLQGTGWIYDSNLKNDIHLAEAAQLSESNFFISLHLIDGQEVKITEHTINGETVYLINYIGLVI